MKLRLVKTYFEAKCNLFSLTSNQFKKLHAIPFGTSECSNLESKADCPIRYVFLNYNIGCGKSVAQVGVKGELEHRDGTIILLKRPNNCIKQKDV